MIANGQFHRAGQHPLVGGGLRVVIIQTTIGWIPAVESVLCGVFGGLIGGEVDLTVTDTIKGPRLIDYTCDSVRKGRRADTIEDNRSNCHLSCVGLASCLAVDDSGKQIQV